MLAPAAIDAAGRQRMRTGPDGDYAVVDDPEELGRLATPATGRDASDGRLEALLAIDAVYCAACTTAIDAALADQVDTVEVNVASRRARIVWRQSAHPLSGILTTLARVGYPARPIPLSLHGPIDARSRRTALWRMMLGLLCMMQVMMLATPRYIGGDAIPDDLRRLMIIAEGMLAVPVLIFAAGPFFQGAWRDARQRRIGMDVPVALGIALAFGASLLAAGPGGDAVYFDSVTMLVALLLVARWLESRARERAATGLANASATLPQTAERIGTDGRIDAVSLLRLASGDRVRVAAGAAIPVDGLVAAGSTAVDESLLTGESRPLERTTGDAVVAGSLNLRQPVEIVVTRPAAESRLAQMQRLVERASATRPRMLGVADRLAGPFLIGILLIAALAAAGWSLIDPARAPWIAVSVLIVTCPCALALAAPSAMIAAVGALARRGIVLADCNTLETLARANVAIFDKTGTLTTGTPQVALIATQGIDAGDAWRIAAALEAHALHPVARAFASHTSGSSDVPLPSATDLQLLPGGGLQGRVPFHDDIATARIGPVGDRIRLTVHPMADGLPALATADFRLAETLRPDAPALIAALRSSGMDCRIASGDEPGRVAAVAAALDIPADRTMALATPESKQAAARTLQAEGRVVLMAGDGINDAPVLRQADVSVSFAGAAPLARHQADVLLAGDRLLAIGEARDRARFAIRIVRQNLAFSLVYNLVAIPLAVAGMVPPWLAGVGMAGSSLIVIANALRAGRS